MARLDQTYLLCIYTVTELKDPPDLLQSLLQLRPDMCVNRTIMKTKTLLMQILLNVGERAASGVPIRQQSSVCNPSSTQLDLQRPVSCECVWMLGV